MTPYRVLVVEDRGTGEKERILESDGNFLESIKYAASHRWNNLTVEQALSLLDGGSVLQTAGFNRYLERR